MRRYGALFTPSEEEGQVMKLPNMAQPFPITLTDLSEQLLAQIPAVDGIPAITAFVFPKATIHILERLQQWLFYSRITRRKVFSVSFV